MLIRSVALVALVTLALVFLPGASAQDAAEPGLVGVYYAIDKPITGYPDVANANATHVRVERTLALQPTSGDFYGTRLDKHFAANFTGLLKIERPGKYRFYLSADDAARLSINNTVVVEHAATSPETPESSGEIELAQGLHRLRIDFYQNTGPASLLIDWKPFFGVREPLPDDLLFHPKGSDDIPWDKAAWEKRPKSDHKPLPPQRPGKYARMVYGNVYSGTIRAPQGNTTNKGIVIKLDRDGRQAAVCFDTELLRMSVAWTDGWLKLPTGRDGIEGQPILEGAPVFSTRPNTPGWLKGDESKDPRHGPRPLGPLPREWGKYKGLYLHGDQTILAYAVGDCDVLETPSLITGNDLDVIARTIALSPTSRTQTLLVFEHPGTARIESNIALVEKDGTVTAAALVHAPAGASLEPLQGRLQLKLAPSQQKSTVQIIHWRGAQSDLPKFTSLLKSLPAPTDPAPLLVNNPPRWTETVTTKGTRAPDTHAYVMDSLTVPFTNPYRSYMRLGALDFFPDGRAAVSTFDGDVWIVSGIDDTLSNLTWKRHATGLFQPLGLVIRDHACSHCGNPTTNNKPQTTHTSPHLYVLGRDQITRLHDLNADGEADFYENFNNDCLTQPFYHEFAVDLHADKQGNFYYLKTSDLSPNGHAHNGTMLKVSPDGSKLEVVAVGFRAQNGMGIGPNGELTASDNQGNWTPLCPINWVTPGHFYGHVHKLYPNASATSERDKPVVWLPMDFDNSAGPQVWVTSDQWGPLKDKLLHLSYGRCTLMHVMFEDVAGTKQGGVVRFPFKFTSGAMRARFHPLDGQLYVAGMKGWQTDANNDGCLHRVRYTGKPAHMPLALHVIKDGLQLTFTDPLDPASANDVESYSAEWFNVKRTRDYGSKDYAVSNPNRLGREPMPIESAKLSPDGKTVTLTVPGLRPVTNVVLKIKLTAADGTKITQEIAQTIHVVPQ